MTNHLQPVESRAEAPPMPRGGVGPPPLLIDGEDGAEYEAMRGDIVGLVNPADVLEAVCVREVADLIWEVKRLRRLKVALIRSTTRRLLQETLRPIIYSDRQPRSPSEDYPNEHRLAVGWATGEHRAVERVRKLLGSFGSSVESLVAQAMASRMEEIERIDRMIVMAKQRRSAADDRRPPRPARRGASPSRRRDGESRGRGEAAQQRGSAGRRRGASAFVLDVSST